MDKIKIGIPRALSYYYFGSKWEKFFEILNIEIIKSPPTDKNIVEAGNMLANDEMCLPLKIYLGHVDYLKDKCDYILIPRIDNYGTFDQTCTNFLAIYDIVNNLFDVKIIDYNIDINNDQDELNGFLKIGKILGIEKESVVKVYNKCKEYSDDLEKNLIKENNNKLNDSRKKILLVAHKYTIYDDYIGQPVINYLNELGVDIIYSDRFCTKLTNKLAYNLSKNIYFKYPKESIGAIELVKGSIDGIIFFTTFPCGLDSLVNELVMRKIDKPYLNLIVDDMDSLTGIKTRLESFVDILEQ